MAKDVFGFVQELRASGKPFAVATVVETTGSVSARTSSKAVIDEQGRVIAGWIGSGVRLPDKLREEQGQPVLATAAG